VSIRDVIIYRVSVDSDTSNINIRCLGNNWLDKTIEGSYASINLIPDKVREKLEMLSILQPSMDDVLEGVGKRLQHDVYWVYL
jgi:hypothetical protein|tara:strand:- start:165 stop:413 length:249 start_codon:yes stop_codon:yes gene_type:complete